MTSTVTQPISDKAQRLIGEARTWAEGWFNLADFLENNPEIAGHANSISYGYVLCGVDLLKDPSAFITSAAAKAVEVGAVVESYQGREHGGIHIFFGPAKIDIYADLCKVYTSQVVGMVEQVEYAPLFSIPSQDGEGKK